MAIELCRKGFKDVSISTKALYDLPSWRAGGFFDPGTGEETTLPLQLRTRRALETFHVFHQIEHGNHPYLLSNVVRRLPLYSMAHSKTGVEVLEKFNYMPPRQLVTIDFGNGIVHENYAKYITYFIDVAQVMKQLWTEVKKLKIPVIIEEICSFEQCTQDIICNCAGLAGGTLAQDELVYTQRGHFFLLNTEAGDAHMNYMLFTKVPQGEKDEYLYVFPKNSVHTAEYPDGRACSGMLGGTFIVDSDTLSKEELQKLDETEFQKLQERAQEFFYGKDL
ncbi:hypothetical protein H0X06_00325 [Candidatus Dependentiae bacterium]|nr:hypothetical protein [Candidatus Dependentiae bacterium]